MHSSPTKPVGSSAIDGLSTRSTVSLMGRPSGTERSASGRGAGMRCVAAKVVHSVGP
jgi:hypothetical protein